MKSSAKLRTVVRDDTRMLVGIGQDSWARDIAMVPSLASPSPQAAAITANPITRSSWGASHPSGAGWTTWRGCATRPTHPGKYHPTP